MKTSSEKQDLAKFPIFAGLSLLQLKKIRNIIIEKNYRANEEIIKEGDKGDNLFLLLKGRVEVSKSLTLLVARGDIDNREKSLVQLKAEDVPYFGEMSLVRKDSARSATIKAAENCVVAIINKNDLMALCEADTVLGFCLFKNIANTLAKHLEKANRDIMKLTTAFSFALQD